MPDHEKVAADRAGLWVLGACALWLVVQNSVLVVVLLSRLDLSKVLAVGEAMIKVGLAMVTEGAPLVWGALVGLTVAAGVGSSLLAAGLSSESEAKNG